MNRTIWLRKEDALRHACADASTYTEAEQDAWWRGYVDGQITGPDSMHVITPYDDVADEESPLYDAWQAGYDAAA